MKNHNSKFKIKRTELTTEEVKQVARLANLELTEEEVKKFRTQLSEVLQYVEKLKEVNTEKVESTSQVTGLENVFREDEIKPSLKIKTGFFRTKGIK